MMVIWMPALPSTTKGGPFPRFRTPPPERAVAARLHNAVRWGWEGSVAMVEQVRGNRGRGSGRGQLQVGAGSSTACAGRGWQGDGGRGGGRQRERRRRRVSGGIYIWWRVASPWAAASLIPQLLVVLLWLCITINNYLPQVDHGNRVMYLYHVHARPVDTPKCGAASEVSQPDLSAVKAELFRLCASQFSAKVVADDGRRSLLSPGLLPEGGFLMAVHGRVFHVTFKLVKSVTSFGSETHPHAKH